LVARFFEKNGLLLAGQAQEQDYGWDIKELNQSQKMSAIR